MNALRKAGITQAELARRTGMGQPFLSGIKAGDKGVSLENILKMIEATGLSGDDFFVREDGPPGLSEPGAVPWDVPADRQRALTRALGLRPESPLWREVRENLPHLLLRVGDAVLVDLNGTADPGDMVLATELDPETGEAATFVRRWLPPYLVTGGPDDVPARTDDDAGSGAILGKVLAVVRQTGTAQPTPRRLAAPASEDH